MKFSLELLLPVVHFNGKFAKFQAAYLDGCVYYLKQKNCIDIHIHTKNDKRKKTETELVKSECHLQYIQTAEIRNDEIMQC